MVLVAALLDQWTPDAIVDAALKIGLPGVALIGLIAIGYRLACARQARFGGGGK